MTLVRRRALLGLATMMTMGFGTLVTPVAASAAEGGPVTVSVGSLALEPTDRGYTGTLATTVRNTGMEMVELSAVAIVEPVANSWQDIDVDGTCTFNWNADGRRTIFCEPGIGLAPGEERRIESTFQVLSKTRKYAMEALGGEVTVSVNYGTFRSTAQFSTLFRSTRGSVADPRPFVQDTRSDITLKVGKALTLTRDVDGRFRGRLRVKLTWHGNAPHQSVPVVLLGLPSGVLAEGTDPVGGMPCWIGCEAPGGAFMQGETRTFDLIVSAAEDVVVGDYGTITAASSVFWGPPWEDMPDVDPADNTRTLRFKIVG